MWIAQPQQLSCTPMLVVWVDQEIPNREPRCEKARNSGLFLTIRKDHLETSSNNNDRGFFSAGGSSRRNPRNECGAALPCSLPSVLSGKYHYSHNCVC